MKMKKELKRQIMDDFFPNQVYIIEEDIVDLIASSQVKITKSNYGSDLDLASAFAVLVNVASFVDNVLNIITFFKNSGNDDPTKEEIISKLPENYDHTIGKEKSIEIIYYIKQNL
jgi:hypothetical protein